jgi:hypothetical protein
MWRMVDGTGSIAHFGVLRDGTGFHALSGHHWIVTKSMEKTLAFTEMMEICGYRIDHGPLVLTVTSKVATAWRENNLELVSEYVIPKFARTGAPLI